MQTGLIDLGPDQTPVADPPSHLHDKEPGQQRSQSSMLHPVLWSCGYRTFYRDRFSLPGVEHLSCHPLSSTQLVRHRFSQPPEHKPEVDEYKCDFTKKYDEGLSTPSSFVSSSTSTSAAALIRFPWENRMVSSPQQHLLSLSTFRASSNRISKNTNSRLSSTPCLGTSQ